MSQVLAFFQLTLKVQIYAGSHRIENNYKQFKEPVSVISSDLSSTGSFLKLSSDKKMEDILWFLLTMLSCSRNARVHFL